MLKNKIAEKYWRKYFSSIEIEKINNSFIAAMSMEMGKDFIENSKKISDLNTLISFYGKFVHPERDIEDETLGIEPKRLKKYIKEHGYNDLDKVFFALNLSFAKQKTLYMDEAGFIDWNKAFKAEFFRNKKPISIKEYVSNKLGKRFDSIEYLLINDKNIEEYIEKKKKEWIRLKGMSPKSLALFIIANPENFSMKRMSLLKEIYKTDKILNLSIVEQIKFSKLISVYSDIFIENGVFIKFEDYFSEQCFLNVDIDRKLLSDIGSFDLVVKLYNKLLNIYHKLEKEELVNIFNKNFREIKNTDSKFIYVNNIADLLQDNNQFDFLLSLSQRQIYNLHLFHLTNSRESIQYMINTWDKRSLEKKFYVEPIRIGKYEISILKSSDKEAFFLGDYTDCCQNIDKRFSDQGRTCITAGLLNKNNGFVQVKKGPQVYAQSWFWEGLNENEEKYICFDSIENVGVTIQQKTTLMKLYEDLSIKLFEKYPEIKYTCFGDSNRIKAGFVEKYEVVKCVIDNEFIKDKYTANYTDTNIDMYKTRLLIRNKNER